MLEVAVSDGVVTKGERQILMDFAQRHQIGDAAVKDMLGDLGWTWAAFHKGSQEGQVVLCASVPQPSQQRGLWGWLRGKVS